METASTLQTPNPRSKILVRAMNRQSSHFKQEAENIALAPSPVETQKAMEASGTDAKLADLIPRIGTSTRVSPRLTTQRSRTGVPLADMLLTVKTAKKDDPLAYIDRVRVGMQQLEGGKDIDKMLGDMEERVKADSVTRDELLREFDELSGAAGPELEFDGKNRVAPSPKPELGLRARMLVARAVDSSSNPAAADCLVETTPPSLTTSSSTSKSREPTRHPLPLPNNSRQRSTHVREGPCRKRKSLSLQTEDIKLK